MTSCSRGTKTARCIAAGAGTARSPGGHSGFGAGRGPASRGSSIPGAGPFQAGPRAEATLIALAGVGGWPCSCERPRRPEVLGVGVVHAGRAATEKATEATARGRGLEAQAGWRSCGRFGVAQTGPPMSTAAGAGIRVPGPHGAMQTQDFHTELARVAEGLTPATRLAKFNRFQPGTRKIRPALFVRGRGRLSKQGEKSHHSRSRKGPGWGAGVGFLSCESRSGHGATRASARGSPVGFPRCSTRRATEFKFDACQGDGLRVATCRPTAAAHRDGGGPHPHGECSRPGTELAHWVRFLQSASPWAGDVAARARVPWHCLGDCRAPGLSGTSARSSPSVKNKQGVRD